MNSDAIVISVTGLVWAENAAGERRLLTAGDTVDVGETLVTSASSRIVLDFGDGRPVVVGGSESVPEPGEEGELPMIVVPESPSQDSGVSSDAPGGGSARSGSLSEGYGFVELVKIAETIEADGVSPLNVSAIDEQLRPLAMTWPERAPETDEERYNRGGEVKNNEAPEATGVIPGQQGIDSETVTVVDTSGYFLDADGAQTLTYTADGLPPGLTIDQTTGVISGTPDSSASQGGDAGHYQVTVTATDSGGETASQSFEWTIDNPGPVADDDTNSVDEDSVLSVTGDGVLANDDDPDGDALSVSRVDGDETSVGQTIAGNNGGLFTINADGSYTFDPNDEFDSLADGDSQDTSVTYTVDDGEGGSDTATLTVTVTREDEGVTVDVPVSHPDTPLAGDTGDQVVFESGLPAGSSPATDDTQVDGSLTLGIPEGMRTSDSVRFGYTDQAGNTATLALDRTEVEALSSSSPRTLTTQYGELVINGYSESDGTITLDYQYTLNSAPGVDAEDAMDSISVTAFDRDGDQASGDLDIRIVDDQPVARDDTGSVTEDDQTTLTDNVFSNDQAGADGSATAGPVTGVQSGSDTSQPVSGNVGISIAGDYGTITLDSDGGYTYTLDNSLPVVQNLGAGDTLTDEFTYTIGDGDGDSSTAQLTVTINGKGDEPTITADDDNDSDANGYTDGQATVYESSLPGGTDSGSTQNQTSGTLQVDARRGLEKLTIDGQDVTEADLRGASEASPVEISTEYGTLSIVGYTPDNSETDTDGHLLDGSGEIRYVYELTQSTQDHDQGAGNATVTDSVDLALTDRDSNTGDASGTLNVTIVDDAPAINPGTGDPTLAVDESNLASGASDSADFSSLFDADFGADGEAATDGTVFSLSIGNSGDSGLVDTATGQTVSLTDAGNGVIEGRNADGDLVFEVTLDAQTGDISLEQHRSVQHGDTSDADEPVTLAEQALSLGLTMKDDDGDTETGSPVNIGNRLSFNDDGPSIVVSTPAFSPDALLTEDAETRAGTSSDSVGYAGAFAIGSKDAGADGEDSVAWDYELGLTGDGSTSLTSAGEAITLTVEGGVVLGTTADDTEIFRLSVDGSGNVTLRQSGPLDHPTTDDTTETTALDAGLIELTGTATITDGDNDTAEDSQTVELGAIEFRDDGPSIGAPASVTVSEEHLPTGSNPDDPALTKTGTLGVTTGGDDDVGAGLFDTAFDTSQTPPTGLSSNNEALSYTFSDQGHTLTATDESGNTVFVATITDAASASAGYEFVLHAPLDNPGSGDDVTLDFDFVVKDADDDTASDSFQVTVTDDNPDTGVPQERTVAEDSGADDDPNTFNTNADATGDNTTIGDGSGGTIAPSHGTPTVNDDGTITYVPDPHFSGTDTFTYTTTTDNDTKTYTVEVTVDPVADAPGLADSGNQQTDEDVAVSLGLTTPTITDDQQAAGAVGEDYPERLGEITLDGVPDGARLLDGHNADAELFESDGGPITVLIQDYLDDGNHLNGLGDGDADLVLTSEQFNALKVLPPAHDADDFSVTAGVASHEVDGNGDPLDGIAPALSETTVDVEVIAVTDPVTLAINGNEEGSHTATIDEDTAFDLTDVLSASFEDLDGSEVRELVIDNLPDGTVVSVDGSETTIGSDGSITIPAPGLGDAVSGFPSITVTPPADFSGDIDGISVTLKSQDTDDDTDLDAHAGNPGEESSSVTLNLKVNPVAGDINESSTQTTDEDTAVAFLSDIAITDDDGASGGNEVITEVSFTVPSDDNGDWVVGKPSAGEGTNWSVSESGGDYTITAENGYNLQDILAEFDITPPGHSSLDTTISVNVTSEDTQTVNATPVTDTATTTHDVAITVNPVAETLDGSNAPTDTDNNGSDDLTMTPGYEYQTVGQEDAWFTLGQEDAFNLEDDWSVEDTDEELFAELTPVLTADNGVQTDPTGSRFRYTDGDGEPVTQIFGGDPIRVPVEYLDSLEFRAAENFSGQFRIDVQAVTVDTDDDGGESVEAVSGTAELTNVLIAPSADVATTTVTARVNGDEDEAMPLSIRPSSSDESESYTVAIDDIPDGAEIVYDGQVLSAGATGLDGISITDNQDGTWKVEIADFDPQAGGAMTIQAPQHSNTPFTLQVSTQTVDELDVGGDSYSDTSDPMPEPPLTVTVTPKGVADEADVDVVAPADQTFAEQDVDAAGGIMLEDLFNSTPSLVDTDGSETLSFKLSGLPDGFGVEGATSLGNGSWVFAEDDFDTIKITTPANFSGTSAAFTLAAVTTENDGDSRTDNHELQVRVEPSPEAGMNLSTAGLEDEPSKVDFSVQHRNGDTDETLTEVWISKSDLDAADGYALTFGQGGDPLTGAEAGVTMDNGWYKLTGSAIDNIYLAGEPNWHGSGSFTVRYGVEDPGNDSTVSAQSAMSGEETYQVTVDAVTDQPGLTVTSGQDQTLDDPGDAVIELDITNAGVDGGDYDGSEQLTRILLDNVPEGVTVEGADFIGNNQWLFITSDDFNSALSQQIKLQVQPEAGDLSDHEIGITVTTEDAGNGDPKTASTSVTLTTNLSDNGGDGEQPADILQWTQTDLEPTEDTAFTLEEAFNGQIEDGVVDNGFNITLTNVPEGMTISGMTATTINGETVWTASGSGDNSALQALLQGISITPPADYNRHDGSLDFDAKLTTYVPSGVRNEATIEPGASFDIQPVSDAPDISIAAPGVDEGGDVTFTLELGNEADSPDWSLVDGELYLKLDESGIDGTGELKDSEGNTLTPTSVSGVAGLDDGDYIVITGVDPNNPLSFTYTPATEYVSGSVSLQAYARSTENGSAVVEAGTATGTAEVRPVNSGYDFTVSDASGSENANQQALEDKSNVIRLDIADNGLADSDGSESIGTVLLRDVPNGFLVFVGNNASDATVAELSNNAGGDDGTNTWLLGQGEIPGYVGIMPPQYWSGPVSDLALQVTSGEAGLSAEQVSEQVFDLSVSPQADGLNSMEPTPSFGTEGDIIPLNLNHELADPDSAGDGDASTETLTLEFSGMGEHAAFYVDGVLIDGTDGGPDAPGVSYDAGTYTVTGLSSTQAEQLAFVQAAGDLNSVEVRARTEETGGGSASPWTDWKSVDTSGVTEQFGTVGSDDLLWTGQALDAFGGEDTVQLRFDESVGGAELAGKLSNVEAIDMGGMGDNAIETLSASDVLDMTDADNELRISGDAGDRLSLDSSGDLWTQGGSAGGYTTYTATTGGQDITLEVQDTLTVE